ncbi:MAG: ABC transporter permease [Deinococcales bacterium]
MRTRLSPGLLIGAGLALMLLLVLPTLALLARSARPAFLAAVLDPTVTAALRLSLGTTAVSLLATVVLGTPVAYLLARFTFRGKVLLEALLDLPLVLPPVVAGLALLLLVGRRGLLGAPLAAMGVHVAFTSVAVVLAQLFVASPLYVRSMKAAFRATPPSLEAAAVTLHASRMRAFRRVTLPLTLPAFIEGCVLTWTRALGEFGATIVVAGSLAGRTQTMPLAIYAELERNLDAALAMGAILTLAAFALLLAFRRLTRAT